mgnify:CR=1 FL=1
MILSRSLVTKKIEIIVYIQNICLKNLKKRTPTLIWFGI